MTGTWLDKLKSVLGRDVSEVFKDVSRVMTTDVGDLINDRRAQAIVTLIAKDPDNLSLYPSLAEIYVELGKPEKALKIYYEMAHKFSQEGRYSDAEFLIRHGLEIDPGHAGLLMLDGDLSFRNGNLREAIANYKRSADGFVKDGNVNTAIYLLQRVVSLGSTVKEDRLHLASLLISTKRIDEAIEILDPLIEELRRGSTAALPLLDASLKLRYLISSDDVEVAEKYIQVLLVLERYDDALRVIRKVLNRHPNEVTILRKELFAYEKLGRKSEAIAVCKRLAHIYGDQGNVPKKKIYLAKVLQFDSRDVEALFQLGGEKTVQEYVNRAITSETTTTNFRWLKHGDDEEDS